MSFSALLTSQGFFHTSKEVLPEQFTFYPELTSIKAKPIEGAHIIEGNAFCALVEFGEVPAYTQTTMFRKSALTGFLFNKTLPICEDLEFFLRACINGKVAFNSKVLAYVRRHDSNATKDISLIPLHKLKAFLSLNNSERLSAEMYMALNNRIIKCYIDYSSSLMQKGFKVLAWKNFGTGLTVKGSAQRKAKGFLRLLLQSFYRIK
jgi:hypothetical protein